MSPFELKEWRQRLGLTQEAAAKLFAVSRVTEQNWEQGSTPVPDRIEILLKRQAAFGPVILHYGELPVWGLRAVVGGRHAEACPTNEAAFQRCLEMWGKPDFQAPFITDRFDLMIWPGAVLEQEIRRRLATKSGKPTAEEIERRMRLLTEIQDEVRKLPDLNPGFTDKDLYDDETGFFK